MNYICSMKKFYVWLKTKWLLMRLRKDRRFMERNCIERIRQGQTSCAGECAVNDWWEIQSIINESVKVSLNPTVSSELQSEDK